MENLIYRDNRGTIETLGKQVDVIRITSYPETTRARHMHKKSSHLCSVVKGSVWYYSKPSGSNEKIKLEVYKPGSLFFTGPNEDHEMFFSEFTIFDCYSFGSRSKEDYETDLVRLDYSMKEAFFNESLRH